MELDLGGGQPLKVFTRALQTLSRIGDDLDFSCTSARLSISTVNSSRTAFGIVHFYPRFFGLYEVQGRQAQRDDSVGTDARTPREKPFKFSLAGKALLSALRPRAANSVETCAISVTDSDDPNRRRAEEGIESGECRIHIYLHCQHNVRKHHSLPYSHPSVQNWARFDVSSCTSTWTASSRVLKEWTDHFHLRTAGGGNASATDEITFYMTKDECRLRSFNDGEGALSTKSSHHGENFQERAIATELAVDVGDFDEYKIGNAQETDSQEFEPTAEGDEEVVVTFALKEFKAIIALSAPSAPSTSSSSHSHASAPSLPLTAHFTSGGRPIMFHLPSSTGSAGAWEARWVVATTDYDSGGGTTGVKKGSGAVKREKSESVAAPAAAARKDKGKGKEKALFNPPATPAGQQQDDEDDLYGAAGDLGGFDDGGAGFEDEEAAWAEIDRLSQMATQQQQEHRAQGTRGVSVASQGGGGGEDWEFEGMEGGQASAPDATKGTQLGPTQKGGGGKVGGWVGGGEAAAEEDERAAKKPRWNLLGDG
ncbi:cell cycle checkpoint control protein RAD9A [Rhodotorula toruloides]|uniref:BY PROTMAP: gi/472580951/gb/EMS18712.1/ cell cycle checkpoint control protein RAD9A [Rhodosporidium toruloides NP11] gi/647402675/emb/CDR48889.1/ RHTO0S21e01046g1_1 [Rhodosporidium toruloides] n=1 Tax=Rhodotorula toruloides TaxID=5286 RepID=A0A0K3CKB4_RHOTO|nr:cell cycle checkpoint control protein RAD9A [Rhodotorula toruloides]PRQ72443.1 Rad9-domain containing protein [Rhodotorula toruloides]